MESLIEEAQIIPEEIPQIIPENIEEKRAEKEEKTKIKESIDEIMLNQPIISYIMEKFDGKIIN